VYFGVPLLKVQRTDNTAVVFIRTSAQKILWHSLSSFCRQVRDVQEMVLQLQRKHFRIPHHQPFGSRKAQGGCVACTFSSRRDHSGVLQLWMQKCLFAGFHSCQERYSCCSSLPVCLFLLQCLPVTISLHWCDFSNFCFISKNSQPCASMPSSKDMNWDTS
jgi:hypothetical protein